MQISDHYQPFEKKTVIAITNNERARLLCAVGRCVEEIEVIDTPVTDAIELTISPHGQGEADFDAMKLHRLKELYTALNLRLRNMLDHEDYLDAIVCVPEINKHLFVDQLPHDLSKKIAEVVPKNLASMDIQHVVRILLEN